jgi:hypothetical protein
MKEVIKKIPILGDVARRIYRCYRKPAPFSGSVVYWENRYRVGGNSGVGSCGPLREFKAEVLNNFVATHNVQTVIEFGCGDGNQLGLAKYPNYLGFDVSNTAVVQCRKVFESDSHKSFRLMSQYDGERATLALSLDVIYHLVEDDVFEQYMQTLVSASSQYVIIYSSDSDNNRGYVGTHVRHRQFTNWMHEHLPNWKLIEHLPNRYPYRGNYAEGSFSEFFVYEKI